LSSKLVHHGKGAADYCGLPGGIDLKLVLLEGVYLRIFTEVDEALNKRLTPAHSAFSAP
jgi:hypothetical protein